MPLSVVNNVYILEQKQVVFYSLIKLQRTTILIILIPCIFSYYFSSIWFLKIILLKVFQYNFTLVIISAAFAYVYLTKILLILNLRLLQILLIEYSQNAKKFAKWALHSS